MMANNAAGQQARPPFFGTGGPAPNQGPGIRGPAGMQHVYLNIIYSFFFFTIRL